MIANKNTDINKVKLLINKNISNSLKNSGKKYQQFMANILGKLNHESKTHYYMILRLMIKATFKIR